LRFADDAPPVPDRITVPDPSSSGLVGTARRVIAI
jgi:hypothetical protein